LNETGAAIDLVVTDSVPTVTAVSPAELAVVEYTAAPLTVHLSAAQPNPTVVGVATDAEQWVLRVPTMVTVPAGAREAAFPIRAYSVGRALVTAGPLNDSITQASVTVVEGQRTLTMIPPTATIAVGETQSFKLMAFSTDGVVQDETAWATWQSANTTVANVVGKGKYIGLAPGTITVSARSGGGGPWLPAELTVALPSGVTLAVSPTEPRRFVGGHVSFQAMAASADGSTHDVTSAVLWTSSDVTVATIASGGVATCVSSGMTSISARIGPVSAVTVLTVTPPPPPTIAIGPVTPTAAAGDRMQFKATATYWDGTTQDVTPAAVWTSSEPAIATITASGRASALAVGATIIAATHPYGTASTTLTVALSPPSIDHLIPPTGQVGTVVTLLGVGLGGATAIAFNGIAAVYSVHSGSHVTTVVPPGAASGPVRVTTPAGTAISGASFTVVSPPTITIDSPADGTNLTTDRVVVRGTVEAGGAEVGVVVNNVVAQVVGSTWVVPEVRLAAGETNTLTATATNPWGGTATTSISITVPLEPQLPLVALRASPASGIAPLTVTFAVDSGLSKPIVSITLDFGDGSPPVALATLEGAAHTYTAEGIYEVTATVTDSDGTTLVDTVPVSIVPLPDFPGKWLSLTAGLARGDAAATLQEFASGIRERYRSALEGLGEDLGVVTTGVQSFHMLEVTSSVAEAAVIRTEEGEARLYFIYFVPDTDGIWRIMGM
jgi:hypothetical protein